MTNPTLSDRAADALKAYAILLRFLAKHGVGEAQPLAEDADSIAAELVQEADYGR